MNEQEAACAAAVSEQEASLDAVEQAASPNVAPAEQIVALDAAAREQTALGTGPAEQTASFMEVALVTMVALRPAGRARKF